MIISNQKHDELIKILSDAKSTTSEGCFVRRS